MFVLMAHAAGAAEPYVVDEGDRDRLVARRVTLTAKHPETTYWVEAK